MKRSACACIPSKCPLSDMILFPGLPAATLITTLPCPILSECVISCHELPAATLIMTLPCPILSECVILCHKFPSVTPMMHRTSFLLAVIPLTHLVVHRSLPQPHHQSPTLLYRLPLTPIRPAILLHLREPIWLVRLHLEHNHPTLNPRYRTTHYSRLLSHILLLHRLGMRLGDMTQYHR